SEAGGKKCDQSFGKQCFIKLPLQGFQLIDRHRRIEFLDRIAQRHVGGLRTHSSSHVKHDGSIPIVRNEDLSSDTFGRTFVQTIADDTDYLDVWLTARSELAQMATDSTLIAEEVLRKMFVDDCNLNVFPDISSIKIASFQNRNSHRLEVAGRWRIH